MRRVSEGVQAQAPPDRAQAATQRRETVPMLEMPQAFLALGLLQPAHEPPLLLLQALQRVGTAPPSCKYMEYLVDNYY